MNIIETAENKTNSELIKIGEEKIVFADCVDGMEIVDNKTLGMATDLLKRIKDRLKQIEEDRKSIVTPINDSVKKINAKYKPIKDFLELLKMKLDSEKIIPYQLEQREKATKEAERQKKEELERLKASQEKAQKLADEHGSETLQNFADEKKLEADIVEEKELEIKTTFKTSDSTSSLKGTWKAIIIDEKLIPREFCKPVQSLLNAAITRGMREIPGVEIKEEFSTVSR